VLLSSCLSFLADHDTTLGAFHVKGTLSGFSGSLLLAGDGVRRGRLADRGLGGAGDSDRGLGAGICRGGEREGRAGLGGAGAGAGEGRLLSRDIDLLAGAGGGADTEESLLRSGLLYSNLIASLIFALLEAVLATDKFLDFLLGDDDLLLVELLISCPLPILITLLDLCAFFSLLSDRTPGSRGRREFFHLTS